MAPTALKTKHIWSLWVPWHITDLPHATNCFKIKWKSIVLRDVKSHVLSGFLAHVSDCFKNKANGTTSWVVKSHVLSGLLTHHPKTIKKAWLLAISDMCQKPIHYMQFQKCKNSYVLKQIWHVLTCAKNPDITCNLTCQKQLCFKADLAWARSPWFAFLQKCKNSYVLKQSEHGRRNRSKDRGFLQ